MSSELSKTYNPAEVEPQVDARWRDTGAFHAEADAPGEPDCIVIPPPNVTAALHMGHALNNTLQDILIRWRRMAGDNVLWMPGTDHAGIATQAVVDKRLQQEGQLTLKEYKKLEEQGQGGREKFIAKVQAWKDQYEARITEQLKRMGCSCDWDRQRFTMDPTCAAAVQEAFFRLFKDGLIYRGKRLVNWDPATQTALADDEVEMRDVDGFFWYMKYPIVDPDDDTDTGEFATVATTRPETMLGDTAVAVNPKDPQRAHLIGKCVRLPIVNRIIPIIGDDYVVMPDPQSSDDMARFASGFLKVTPAHDPNDYEIGQRHTPDPLPVINVMAPDGTISRNHGWPAEEWEQNDQAAEDHGSKSGRPHVAPFAHDLLGQQREQARNMIVKWFEDNDLMDQVRPYRHAVGHSYRSHVPIEPYLSDQWYVKVTDDRLAGAALGAMAPDQRTDGGTAGSGKGQLRFTPARYAKTFQTWHENIRDWCISRQLWWGHRIPVWSKTFQLRDGHMPDEQASELTGALASSENAVVVSVTPDHSRIDWADKSSDAPDGQYVTYVCLRDGTIDIGRGFETDDPVTALREAGFTQDPDVLDTWFSSALWPFSTMGWPGDTPELRTWNPGNVLCTAREIITLWVSRMVMTNLYSRGCLPFTDGFIHAMIQDGHGQKMSKSLGNGVDPVDIIDTHGADAMRYTLAVMTTQTQDVRLPVDMICPHTGQLFTPETITDAAGHVVAAPVQACPTDKNKKMVSSYGASSGKAAPTDDQPLARNTSSKFDVGRNFSNKLWNAVRFALTNLQASEDPAATTAVKTADLGLADQWILSRVARVARDATAALEQFEFSNYGQSLYDFIWRDLCDWYIEAVKPTVQANAAQRRVLASAIDVSLRLLHPAMPFITERLWQQLNEVAPDRGVDGLDLPTTDMLCLTKWPTPDDALISDDVEAQFERVQILVSAIRQVRTTNKVSPRQTVPVSAKAAPEVADRITARKALIETLANCELIAAGPSQTKPDDAAATVAVDVELYLHGLIDRSAERDRLTKQLGEVQKSAKMLEGRLSNTSYIDKAPKHLVHQTREQLADAQKQAEAIEAQLATLH